ncbi:hypothetical protein CPC735_055630 [Coccidioides posadasii C735 delta SOWgp]|uniref:UBL3-like ubiquitin domain-containing protein n=1 Tax=Coccidioides posadasii (strain C735) TaxID=222929 RepID=C5PI40_COCP7|nr:hypothetical protein CPC735_055630 [Coccidioides posadasii C735 delta SOWgp]EER24193.1 hypothetical protein CPC735_055630 [Coccidioides posadasii C735 delta SOWgp]|eukprot:XP_003066338.1 hypothetical protein CPC735_055630 [Coccidioides posadasii C735 delta SOWgp]
MAPNTTEEPDLGSSHESNCPTTQPESGNTASSQPLVSSSPIDEAQTVPSTNQLDVRSVTEPLTPPSSTPPPAEHFGIPPPLSASNPESLAIVTMSPTSTSPSEQPQQTSDTPQQPQTFSPEAQLNSESSEPKPLSPAIGPSSDLPSPSPKESEDAGIPLVITLLLTTGARHPFKIDGRYLRKREVNVPDNDPFAMSVYTLKELIWREWRSEWEPRPSSPSLIRLISFGKLLDDKAPLSDSKFNRDAPNVVHMTVKPQDIVDEEDAKAPKGHYHRDREDGDRSPSCRCIIL